MRTFVGCVALIMLHGIWWKIHIIIIITITTQKRTV